MAGDDNQLVFEFVLDEKSVDKGMAGVEDKAKDSSKKLSDIFSKITTGKDGFFGLLTGATLLNQSLELVGKTIQFIKSAFNEAVEAVTAGEKLKAVGKQFDILSNQAVGAGNNLREALSKASGGLVDQDELLKATNKILVEFKGNVADLPKLLEASRKISKISGNDLLDTFKDLNLAIGTQSTRVLRQSGIFLDAAEVEKKYADAIHKRSDQLKEVEKRQAITNEILRISDNQLKDISISTDTALGAFKKFGAQSNELGNILSTLTSNVLKPLVVPITNFGTNLLKIVNENLIATFGSGAEQSAAQISVLTREIERLDKTLEIQKKSLFDQPLIDQTQNRLERARTELKAVQDMAAIAADDAKKAAARRGDIPENIKALLDSFIPDPKEVAKRQQEFATAFLAAQQQNLQLQIASAELIVNEDQKNFELRKLRLGQIELEEQNHKAKLQALENQFQIEKTLTQAQYNDLRNQENIRSQLQTEAYEAQSNEKKRKQALDYQAKITSINQAIQQGILKTVSSAAERLGASLVKGGDAFADFRAVVLGIIGDIAIQIGGTLVGIGLGIEAIKASILTLSGGTAIAAGLALIALGGLLKSLSGGGSSSSADVGGSGGGIATSPAEGGIFTPDDDQKPQTPGQSVVVNVQGNILDRRQTGLELAEVIRESFESQGTTIVGAV
jgi:hypothetical protein